MLCFEDLSHFCAFGCTTCGGGRWAPGGSDFACCVWRLWAAPPAPPVVVGGGPLVGVTLLVWRLWPRRSQGGRRRAPRGPQESHRRAPGGPQEDPTRAPTRAPGEPQEGPRGHVSQAGPWPRPGPGPGPGPGPCPGPWPGPGPGPAWAWAWAGLAWPGLGVGVGGVAPPKKVPGKKTASLKKGNMTRGVPKKSKFIINFFGDASRHIAFFSKLAIFFLELFLGGHPSHPPPPPAQARPAQAKAQAKAQTQAQAKAQAHRPRPPSWCLLVPPGGALGRPGAALGRALGRALVGGARQIPISWPAP